MLKLQNSLSNFYQNLQIELGLSAIARFEKPTIKDSDVPSVYGYDDASRVRSQIG